MERTCVELQRGHVRTHFDKIDTMLFGLYCFRILIACCFHIHCSVLFSYTLQWSLWKDNGGVHVHVTTMHCACNTVFMCIKHNLFQAQTYGN